MYEKIFNYKSKLKNPSRLSSKLFISLSLAKNRLLISSKTAALGVPRKNGNLKKATLGLFVHKNWPYWNY